MMFLKFRQVLPPRGVFRLNEFAADVSLERLLHIIPKTIIRIIKIF